MGSWWASPLFAFALLTVAACGNGRDAQPGSTESNDSAEMATNSTNDGAFRPQGAKPPPTDFENPSAQRAYCQIIEESFGGEMSNPERRVIYGFDLLGYLVSIEDDNGADGHVDVRTQRVLNDQNQTLYQSIDRGGEGVIDDTLTYFYESGRLVLEVHDSDGDGRANGQRTFIYDVQGNLVQTDFELLPEGVVTQRVTTTFDSQSRPTIVETAEGEPLSAVSTVRFTYDDLNRVKSIATAIDEDGGAQRQTEYTYDDENYTVLEETDLDGNQEIDVRTTSRYDASGLLLSEELERLHSMESDVAMAPTRSTREYTYTEGFVATVQHDFDADGTVDQVDQYVYDNLLRVVERTIVDGGDSGQVRNRWIYAYVCNGPPAP